MNRIPRVLRFGPAYWLAILSLDAAVASLREAFKGLAFRERWNPCV